MRYFGMLLAVLAAADSFAGEKMGVAICGGAYLPRYVIDEAEREVSFVFQGAEIDVIWLDCEAATDPIRTDSHPKFIIRMRNDWIPRYAGTLSLHAMGRAFVSSEGDGYLADVYYPAVRDFAQVWQAKESWLVGYTIAHELGHLLLGPGHRAHGIMRTGWSTPEIQALSQRHLGFERSDQVRMREKLRLESSRGAVPSTEAR
jgi:hypothetical protein